MRIMRINQLDLREKKLYDESLKCKKFKKKKDSIGKKDIKLI